MRIKNTKVFGLEKSIIRSGYPMQTTEPKDFGSSYINIAEHLNRAKKLARAKTGTGHDTFLKGIIVQFDLQYPQYFSLQLQRYHWVDIISSQSKMHKLTSIKDISGNCNKYVLDEPIKTVNMLIDIYNSNDFPIIFYSGGKEVSVENRKQCFQYIVSNLPMGFELWQAITTNYLQLKTIYFQRKNHKLEEWQYFTNWVENLPMFTDLIL